MMIAVLLGCRADEAGGLLDAVLSEPPHREGVGLAAVLTLHTDSPCALEIELDAGDHHRTIAPPGLAQVHDRPILGLRADRDYDVDLRCTDAHGRVGTAALQFTTPPLPSDFPTFEVVVHHPDDVEPGLILLGVSSRDVDWLLVLDEALEPVWALRADGGTVQLVVPSVRGSLLVAGYPSVSELTWLGEVAQRWTSDPRSPSDIDTGFPLHHEAIPLPDGGFVTLASRERTAELPVDYELSDTAVTGIIDDAVVRVGPNGSPEWGYWMADRLDPSRIGFDSLDPGRDLSDSADWGHTNGVALDPTDGGVIVSVRHQDALVKLTADGELAWILGNPSGWEEPWRSKLLAPVGDLAWPFHAHAPAVAPDGTLLVFDNGNVRSSPYDGPRDDAIRYSRVVAYRVDEVAGTVAQAWEYRTTPLGELYAWAMGDADPLPTTGHVLAVYGSVLGVGGAPNASRGWAEIAAHVVEFDPRAPDSTSLHLVVVGDGQGSPEGWRMYRAERILGFYPWEQVSPRRR